MEEMETQEPIDNQSIAPKPPKKKIFFFIGVLVGLMLGMVLTMLIINIIDKGNPSVVRVFDSSSTAPDNDVPDTVTQTVVKKSSIDKSNEEAEYYAYQDTASVDSIYAEDASQDLMLDETELQEVQNDETSEHVASTKLLHSCIIKVIFLNDNKLETTPSGNATLEFHVQQWDTPIKNKLSYYLTNNILKIKGLNIEHLKIIHFKNIYYLVNGTHYYPIRQNKQYEKLAETHNLLQ